MWQNMDFRTVVFQWKNYAPRTDPKENIPISLVFRKSAERTNSHTLTLAPGPGTIWTNDVKMGRAYRIGLVTNTSQKSGYLHMYFEGDLVSMNFAPTLQSFGKTLHGNFFLGADNCSPKIGLYGGKNNLVTDAFVCNFVVGTSLRDIKSVAGIYD